MLAPQLSRKDGLNLGGKSGANDDAVGKYGVANSRLKEGIIRVTKKEDTNQDREVAEVLV